MGKSRKILLYICLIICLFIVGMVVRRFYDNYVLEPSAAASGATAQTLHRVIEPAAALPVPAAQNNQQQ